MGQARGGGGTCSSSTVNNTDTVPALMQLGEKTIKQAITGTGGGLIRGLQRNGTQRRFLLYYIVLYHIVSYYIMRNRDLFQGIGLQLQEQSSLKFMTGQQDEKFVEGFSKR